MDYPWLIALYFLPTIISLFNKRSSTFVIFVGNLLFSWTVIFWFGSLLWAFCDTKTIQLIDEEDEVDTPSPEKAKRSRNLNNYVDPLLQWWKHL
ncbi:MAG: superinfection immunity protein [Fluviibacter phosphoraccumulans]